MSEQATLATTDEAPKAGAPDPAAPRWTDLGRRVRPIVEAFIARLPGVRSAYVRRDGADFILAGDGWSVELSEAAAELSVALQRAFEPGFGVSIEGGYQPFREGEIEGYETVYRRS
jgi:hypothetical protein